MSELREARNVIFFDVDGTLVWDGDVDDPDNTIVDRTPSPAVYEAFRQLRARGHQAFICTGRTLDTIRPSLLDLEPVGIVCGAGACIVMDGEILQETSIPRDLLYETVEHVHALGVEVVFEGARESAALMNPGRTYTAIPGVPTAHSWEELAEVAPALEFEKFAFYAEAIPVLKRDEAFFAAHYDLCDLGIGLGEMSLRGVNKGLGVANALKVLDEGPWRTYAIGDSENDLPMLAAVDVPIAMGNAQPQVKTVASYVTDTVRNDGAIKALRHFGLI